MNKGDLIYLKMSNGDRAFINVNEVVIVLVSHTTKSNSDDNNISTETFETKLEFCFKSFIICIPLMTMILMVWQF